MKRYIKATALNPLDEQLNEQLYLCEEPDTSAEVLTVLANSPYFEVLQLVARHPNTPEMVRQSIDPVVLMNAEERSLIAHRPTTPVKTLELLATDPCSFVQFEVAENPRTPTHVRQEIKNFYSDLVTIISFSIHTAPDKNATILDAAKVATDNLMLTDDTPLNVIRIKIRDSIRFSNLVVIVPWIPLFADKLIVKDAIARQLASIGCALLDWEWEDA